MSLKDSIKDIPEQGGGWFKPADVKDAVAFLIEVVSFEPQRGTPNGPKDSALTNVHTFRTQADLDAGTAEVAKGQRIEQTVLARDLASLAGSATIVKLDQVPAKKPGAHPAWVWRKVDAATRDKVVAYIDKIEAERQAALDSVPSFD